MSGQELTALGLVIGAVAYLVRELWRGWGRLVGDACASTGCHCGTREVLRRSPLSGLPPTGSSGDAQSADFSQERPESLC